jgi:hypothetical protein
MQATGGSTVEPPPEIRIAVATANAICAGLLLDRKASSRMREQRGRDTNVHTFELQRAEPADT